MTDNEFRAKFKACATETAAEVERLRAHNRLLTETLRGRDAWLKQCQAEASGAMKLRARVRVLEEALQDIADHGCDIESGGCGAGYNARVALEDSAKCQGPSHPGCALCR